MRIRKIACLAGIFTSGLLSAACGGGISGDYGGNECLYDKLEFEGGDKVYITMFGMQQPGTYRVDGDRVIVTASNGDALVFTKKGRNLEAKALGETMVCGPL
jgi:hypothetical protein